MTRFLEGGHNPRGLGDEVMSEAIPGIWLPQLGLVDLNESCG